MNGFRCLALEAGVARPTVAACNGDRECEIELSDARKVAGSLFGAIDEALDDVGLSLHDLECIAFGKGPGAFTGLRVAAAAAQGLAAGLGLGLCPVSSLATLAQDALHSQASLSGATDVFVAPVLSAGRGEVYAGWYQAAESGLVVSRGEDRIAEANELRIPGSEPFLAAGGDWEECAVARASEPSRVLGEAPAARPRARAILRLAREDFRLGRAVSPRDAQPVYLRAAV
ncbi:tRNA (adenosine(37)-N6)-threonylcarbamoyltransferase complex dimerization subunit type 1 TsaB [Candidatus Foliamicus sp.]